MVGQNFEDFSRMPELRKYSDVPVGIEIAEGNFRSNPFDLASKYELGQNECAVALWNNAGMADPEKWDDEVKHLNEVQHKLGELSDKVRSVRSLIASYDLFHYNFSKSFYLILEAIGELRATINTPLGWYVSWWPPNQARRFELLEAYISFLTAWEQKQKSLTIRTDKQYKNELLRNIYLKLGDWTASKRNYVLLVIEKLDTFKKFFIYPDEFYNSMELARFDMLAKGNLDRMIGPIEIESRVNRAEDELIKRIEEFKKPIFYHGFFSEVDLWLDWIGRKTGVDFAGASKKRDSEILRSAESFMKVLNSFMERTVNKKDIKLSGDYGAQMDETFKNTGPEHKWLLACLWKTVKEQIIIGSRSNDYSIENKLENNWLLSL